MAKGKIWFMEGLSSQREIIQAVRGYGKGSVLVFASHRHARNEILSVADFSLREPASDDERLDFMGRVIRTHDIRSVHVGRNCRWFESHRDEIESFGASLTTGATSVETFDIADSKVAFAEKMVACGLPVVPSLPISNVAELRTHLTAPPFDSPFLCVKPVRGIYGMGFWIFDERVSAMASFSNPDNRRVRSDVYLRSLAEQDVFEPLVLMPYLPGPEHSVDMLVSNGRVITGVARCKNGLVQELSNSGKEYDLAVACAEAMGADGLINVQTRRDQNGATVLLETNLRPSGGIGYTLNCGVNLPLLFAQLKLGQIDAAAATTTAREAFRPASVRSITTVAPYESALENVIAEASEHV